MTDPIIDSLREGDPNEMMRTIVHLAMGSASGNEMAADMLQKISDDEVIRGRILAFRKRNPKQEDDE